MSKDKLTDYDSTTASNNTDIGGISVAEGMLPSAVNNSIRELTKQLGAFADGTDGIDVLSLADDDASHAIKLQAPSAVTADTTFTLPDGDGASGQTMITDGAGTLSWAAPYGNRNLIINGAMQVAQRGTSASGIGNGNGGYHALDRWSFRETSTPAFEFTWSQSTDTPDGFGYSMKVDVTTQETTAVGYGIIQQRIEGQNLQQLKKGTSSAESVTVSFWVKSNKTGIYIVEIRDADNARHISKSYTISAASTWEQKTITFDGDTTGTLNNDNEESLRLNFWLVADTNYTSGALATSWASITNSNRAVGQTNLMDSTSNEWYITGIQLEVGDGPATSFEHRSYADELERCHRYCYSRFLGLGNLAADATYGYTATYSSQYGAGSIVHIDYPRPMRVKPTLTYSQAGGAASSDRSNSNKAQLFDENDLGFIVYDFLAEAEL